MPIRRRKIGAKLIAAIIGVAAAAALTAIIAVFALRSVIVATDRVSSTYANDIVVVETLRSAVERESASARAFLLTADPAPLDRMQAARDELRTAITRLRAHPSSPQEHALLMRIEVVNTEYESALDRVIATRRAEADPAVVRRLFESEISPAKQELSQAVLEVSALIEQQLHAEERTAASVSTRAIMVVIAVAAAALAAAVALGVLLVRAWIEVGRRQEETARLLERIERSNRDLDAFAGRVAHDVRNALGPVVFATEMLRKPGLSRDAAEKSAKALSGAVERAGGLVDALLAFSRPTEGSPTTARASVRATVDAVLGELEPQLAQADATAETAIEEDVDVRCPPALFHTVMANLVGNAVKYMRGCDERRVRISNRTVRGGCEIRVDDTGRGIPESARAHIFDPFFRVPGTAAPGTGIGLATVQRIVEAHGGRIGVESTVGSGSSFCVWLPLAEDASPSAPLANRRPRAEA